MTVAFFDTFDKSQHCAVLSNAISMNTGYFGKNSPFAFVIFSSNIT